MSASAKRILLIDDDERFVSMVGDFLGLEGFEVITAFSAEEALTHVDATAPDLIILDLHMRGIGGIGFLRRITDAKGQTRYPVVVLTGRTEFRGFFDEVIVDGFLAKPCSEDALLSTIREVLERRQVGRMAPNGSWTARMVVIGEDDPDMARRLSSVFVGAGYRSSVAANGPDIIEKAVGLRPDAIISKIVLQRMNADVVASMLHQLRETLTIPLILYDPGGIPSRELERLRTKPGVSRVVSFMHTREVLRATEDAIRSKLKPELSHAK